MGSDESHFNVSLIVRDKVTRQCPQTVTFEDKIVVVRFYIALFSALGQTHCALHARDIERVTIVSCSAFLNIRRSGLLTALSGCQLLGWCRVKLLPSRRTFCARHTTMHQFTVSLRFQPHTCKVRVCFSCNRLLLLFGAKRGPKPFNALLFI